MPDSATASLAQRPASAEGRSLMIRALRPWREAIQAVIALAIVAWLAWVAVGSGAFKLDVIQRYIVSPRILEAIVNTMWLATLCTFLALLLGVVVALMRISRNRVLSSIATGYVFFFRGTPMLVQLLLWYNAVPIAFDRVIIGVPGTALQLVNMPTTEFVTPFIAALFGLTLAETAYMSEVIRSGMLGVDRGQTDAARALGVRKGDITARIVLPQALRIVMPAIGNQYIMMIKNTSLAYVIGYMEILRMVSDIYSVNFRVMELLIVAAVWYLVLTGLVTLLQHFAERMFPAR